MNPWLESAGVALLAISGMLLGWWFSTLQSRWWMLGYFIPLSFVAIYAAGVQYTWIAFTPPISWMVAGRNKIAVFGFICAMLLTTPLSRLPQRRKRIAVFVLMLVIVSFVSIAPFLTQAFNRNYLEHLQTKMDSEGVCRQTDDYNCGPAAAVTALRKLGLPAEIGEIAIAAHSNPLTGAEPETLAAALQKRYHDQGLNAQFRLFKSLDELKAVGPIIVVVKYNFLTDHFVTVLGVTGKNVLVADPLSGLDRMSPDDFLKEWRYCGIVIQMNRRAR